MKTYVHQVQRVRKHGQTKHQSYQINNQARVCYSKTKPHGCRRSRLRVRICRKADGTDDIFFLREGRHDARNKMRDGDHEPHRDERALRPHRCVRARRVPQPYNGKRAIVCVLFSCSTCPPVSLRQRRRRRSIHEGRRQTHEPHHPPHHTCPPVSSCAAA